MTTFAYKSHKSLRGLAAEIRAAVPRDYDYDDQLDTQRTYSGRSRVRAEFIDSVKKKPTKIYAEPREVVNLLARKVRR